MQNILHDAQSVNPLPCLYVEATPHMVHVFTRWIEDVRAGKDEGDTMVVAFRSWLPDDIAYLHPDEDVQTLLGLLLGTIPVAGRA